MTRKDLPCQQFRADWDADKEHPIGTLRQHVRLTKSKSEIRYSALYILPGEMLFS